MVRIGLILLNICKQTLASTFDDVNFSVNIQNISIYPLQLPSYWYF